MMRSADPNVDEEDPHVDEQDADEPSKKQRKAYRRQKRDPNGLLDLPSDHQEAVSSSDSDQEEDPPASASTGITKTVAQALPLLMFGGLGLGNLAGPIADKATALFTALTLVQKVSGTPRFHLVPVLSTVLAYPC